MGFLTSIIPMPYRILILLALVIGLFGFGFWKGDQWCEGRHASANLKAQIQETRFAGAAAAIGGAGSNKLAAGNTTQQNHDRKLKGDTDATKDSDLCIGGCVFTGRFAGLWNGGWTDQAGQPIFPGTGGPAAESGNAGAVATVDVHAVLDNQQDNAGIESRNARRLNQLIDTLGQLCRQWAVDHPGGFGSCDIYGH